MPKSKAVAAAEKLDTEDFPKGNGDFRTASSGSAVEIEIGTDLEDPPRGILFSADATVSITLWDGTELDNAVLAGRVIHPIIIRQIRAISSGVTAAAFY